MLNQSSTKMQAEGLNQREIYKNKKLEETSQIFYCECGKNYLTFSALYLHARNKHNTKLTTKRSSQNCKIELQGEKTIVTYFTSSPSIDSPLPTSNSPQNQPSNQNASKPRAPLFSPLPVLQHYLNQAQPALSQADRHILQLFQNYLWAVQQTINYQQNQHIDDVTLFFNQFLTFYLPQHSPSSFAGSFLQNQAENTLIKVYKWLKLKGLSKYELFHLSPRNSSGLHDFVQQ